MVLVLLLLLLLLLTRDEDDEWWWKISLLSIPGIPGRSQTRSNETRVERAQISHWQSPSTKQHRATSTTSLLLLLQLCLTATTVCLYREIDSWFDFFSLFLSPSSFSSLSSSSSFLRFLQPAFGSSVTVTNSAHCHNDTTTQQHKRKHDTIQTQQHKHNRERVNESKQTKSLRNLPGNDPSSSLTTSLLVVGEVVGEEEGEGGEERSSSCPCRRRRRRRRRIAGTGAFLIAAKTIGYTIDTLSYNKNVVHTVVDVFVVTVFSFWWIVVT